MKSKFSSTEDKAVLKQTVLVIVSGTSKVGPRNGNYVARQYALSLHFVMNIRSVIGSNPILI